MSPPPKEDKPKRQPTALDIAKLELTAHFEQETGLRIVESESKRRQNAKLWWTPLTAIWKDCDSDTQRAKNAITWAVRRMRSSDLNISSPLSILKVCQSEVAKRRNKVVSSPTVSDDDIEVIRLSLERSGLKRVSAIV